MKYVPDLFDKNRVVPIYRKPIFMLGRAYYENEYCYDTETLRNIKIEDLIEW